MVDSETLKTQESSHIQDVSLEIPFNLSFTCFSRVGAKWRECESVGNVPEYLNKYATWPDNYILLC
mgnify:CR=1 FL=1